jgi:hypothetical protein
MVLIASFLVLSGCANNSTMGHSYYPELDEFTVSMTDDPNSRALITSEPFPSPFQGRFVNREVLIDMRAGNYPALIVEKTAFIFKTVTDAKAYLLVTKGVADSINLIPDEIYQIKYDILRGWPFAYRLILSKENELILAGISTGGFNSRLSLNGLIPVTTTQSKILTDNYIDGNKDVFWDRKINVEIAFNIGGNSINLHQGQSATLDNYKISLLIAREIKYKPNVYDAGQNGISYVVARK